MRLNIKPHTEINSKWIKKLNVRSDSIKALEENIGSNFSDTGYSNICLDMSPEATKAKINYWDYVKTKASAQQRNNQEN